jgi:starch-binding outer membrane protein, SusD/RagB family
MKKYIINSLAALSLIAASCTDLEVKPKHLATPDVVLTTPESYRSFIAKLYAGLAVTGQEGPAGQGDVGGIDEGFSSYLRTYWKAQELSTDEAVIGWGDDGIRDFHFQNWTSQNQFIAGLYYRAYYQISLANEFLRQTTEDKLNERGLSEGLKTEVAEYRTEARFLRALSYWHAMDLFGNIPFVTEADPIGAFMPEQADSQKIFNYIESELLAIENEISAPKTNEYGRADRAAVWMLLSKLYLNAKTYTGTERYSDVITYTKKIIDSGVYSLHENYAGLFLADNHLSPEIIFSINFDGMHTRTWGGMTFLIHAAVGGDIMKAADYGIDGGWGGTRTTSALVDLFPDQTGEIDSRAMFFTEGQNKNITDIGAFTSGFAVVKFKNITSDGSVGSHLTHPDTDFPMFRLADAYLMYAEAVARGAGGSVTEAVGYVNQLRERAYGDDSGNIDDADLSADLILNERARELYWECHRRTDLIRYQLFTDSPDNDPRAVWPWKGNVSGGKETESFRNLYPIPSADIIANTNLKQNPNY